LALELGLKVFEEVLKPLLVISMHVPKTSFDVDSSFSLSKRQQIILDYESVVWFQHFQLHSNAFSNYVHYVKTCHP
jgi:hypothetical protein